MATNERITQLARDLDNAIARADCTRRTLREVGEFGTNEEPSWVSLFWLSIEDLSNAAEALSSEVTRAARS